MSTYAIGDVQGCYDTLQALLARIDYRRGRDRLWLAGDLVNRGPRSLEVLRWARAQRESVVCVLGNHDLHLLARAAGVAGLRKRDTLEALLAARDRERLLDWLRHRPLLHREGRWLLVHAGLLPGWTVAHAEAAAREAEAALRGPDWRALLERWSSGPAAPWASTDEALPPLQRQALTLHLLTRLRMLQPGGEPDYAYSGPPTQGPPGLVPWFSRWHAEHLTVLFGHWAALGRHSAPGIEALDSGCVWGGALTALRLEDGAVFAEPARDAAP
ncbi:MAG: symmetrical bis(5'-nucleosyl)-tetraphosphatase [Proteobacteria bacterium]|nr:symmetrical bis(5'-nucleosyl)-tetraphosphatase [Pseudomonadota bacterium]